MSSILEQINNLTEQFSNLFEVGGIGGNGNDEGTPRIPEVEHINSLNNNKKKEQEYNPKKKQGNLNFKEIYDKIMGKNKEKMNDNQNDQNMNDNNSYNEVVSQINNLTEQFSNLFEVEGLGDPASDVPPSTNKIKKDRKTKDGKVELVSVEDELFPYDGNKREQYRQKIIDTINNMIQGTATLEDLLQIVRQKKAPLKEGFEGAIEILENIIAERKYSEEEIREIAKKVRPERAKKFNKACDELDKVTQGKNPDNFTSVQKYRANKAAKKVERAEDRLNHVDDIINPTVKTPTGFKRVKEGFEGAIELLEEIINEVSKDMLVQAAKNSLPSREKEYNDLEKKRQEIHKLGSKTRSKKKIESLYNDLKDTLGKEIEANKRYYHAKSIANESYALSELFDRPDLLDDISKTLTNKTIKQHLENQVKKLLGDKKKIKKEK